MTSAGDRALLLQIARAAVIAHVTGGPERPAPRRVDRPAPQTVAPVAPDLASGVGGAFVTIRHRGDLRGCIGHIEADRRLAHVVAECAVSACSADPRFPAIRPDELADIDVEVSLLGPLEPIAGPDEIEIGRHGLLIARAGRRGLLLPQVAMEWKWDAPAFLAQTCRKAGLPADAWRYGADLWRFEAEVFGDAMGPTSGR